MDCGLSYGISYPCKNTNHHQTSTETVWFNYKCPTNEEEFRLPASIDSSASR